MCSHNWELCRIKPSCFHFQRPSKDTQHATTFPHLHDLHFFPSCHRCSPGSSHLVSLLLCPCLNTVYSQHRYQNLPLKIGQDSCHICAQNAPVASHLMRNKSRDLRIGHQGSRPPFLLLILTSVPPCPIARSAPAVLTFCSFGWNTLPPEVFHSSTGPLVHSLIIFNSLLECCLLHKAFLSTPFDIALLATQHFLLQFFHSPYQPPTYYWCYILVSYLCSTWLLSAVVHCWIPSACWTQSWCPIKIGGMDGWLTEHWIGMSRQCKMKILEIWKCTNNKGFWEQRDLILCLNNWCRK